MPVSPIDLAFWGLAVFWTAFTLNRIRAFRAIPVLPQASTVATEPPPRVSVVVPARDEAARIEHTVERLLAQSGVDVELLVVDDRSVDGTAEILHSLQRRHPRLEVIRIDTLPDGWLGKNHACHVAATRATGDWLLFTDADVWLEPDVLFRAVEAARRQDVDHVTLLPGESDVTLMCQATMLFLNIMFLPVVARVNRDARRAFVGVGAFNFVRAEAYRAAGGHEALRLEVVDDLKLGLVLRRAGYRTRIFDANRELKIHWARNIDALFRAVEKNLYAMFHFHLSLVLAAVVLGGLVWGTSLLAPTTGSPAGIAAGGAMLMMALPSLLVARRARWGVLPALLSPLMPPVVCMILVRSVALTLRRGGIRWRGTFYSLARLRAGVVRW